ANWAFAGQAPLSEVEAGLQARRDELTGAPPRYGEPSGPGYRLLEIQQEMGVRPKRPGEMTPIQRDAELAQIDRRATEIQVTRELKEVARSGIDPIAPVLPSTTLTGQLERGA